MPQSGIFTKEERLTLKDKAAQQLREAILSGKLVPGSRLIEQDLSDMMGISRFPLREAMASLEQVGLVTIEPYKGAFVSTPTAAEIEEVYTVRSLLEVHALKTLLEGDTRGVAMLLRQVVKRMDPDLPYLDALRNDLEYHSILCECAGNMTLHRMWLTLSTKIQLYINIELRRGLITAMQESHGALCSLIEGGNKEAALKELKRHLEHGKQTLLAPA